MVVVGLATHGSYLKFKFRTAKISPLFLPKVVWLDYQCNVNAAGEGLLQDLQQRINGLPLGPTHVHNHREAALADFFTGEKENTCSSHTALAPFSGRSPAGRG